MSVITSVELRTGNGPPVSVCKKTDIGTLPEDWNIVNIGDLEPFVTSGSRGWARYYSDFGDPFLRITNMSRGTIYLDLSDLKFVELPAHQCEAERTQLRLGDVLISITADIGIIGYVDSCVPLPAYINQHIAVVRFDPARMDSKFASYFLASEHPQKLFRNLTDQGAKAGMSLLTVRKIALAYPRVEEQRAIAAGLSDVDALIGALDKLIAKKRAIKLATMQQLLTGKTRLPGFEIHRGFTNTDIGPMPKDWVVRKLIEVSDIKTGPFGSSLHASDYVADGTPIVTVEHLGEFGLLHSRVPMISDLDRARLQAYALTEGDIVFSRVGSVDRNALVRQAEAGWLFSGRLLRLRPHASLINSPFLSYQFHGEDFKRRARSVAVGQTMASLNTVLLGSVDVAVPGLKEQEAIAELLSDMDAEIHALEKRRKKSMLVKQAMMQALLTGNVRLV